MPDPETRTKRTLTLSQTVKDMAQNPMNVEIVTETQVGYAPDKPEIELLFENSIVRFLEAGPHQVCVRGLGQGPSRQNKPAREKAGKPRTVAEMNVRSARLLSQPQYGAEAGRAVEYRAHSSAGDKPIYLW